MSDETFNQLPALNACYLYLIYDWHHLPFHFERTKRGQLSSERWLLYSNDIADMDNYRPVQIRVPEIQGQLSNLRSVIKN